MRKCELCDRTARMYCESDQASLCWDCDEKVHRANFLVAKHSRSLLCHVCQSLTPWKASGAKLGPTVSVCESCVATAASVTAQCRARDGGVIIRRENHSERSDAGDDDVNVDVDDYDNDDGDDYDDDEDDDADEEEIDLEEDDENQVVPWSGESHSPSPPPVSCSSSSSGGSEEEVSFKRRRDFVDLYSDDEIGCSSSHIGSRATANEEANTSSNMSSFRPLKQPRASEPDDDQADSRSTAIINSLHRLQKQLITNDGGDASAATVLAICRLSKDESR